MSEDTDMRCPDCGGELPGPPNKFSKCCHCGGKLYWGGGKPLKRPKLTDKPVVIKPLSPITYEPPEVPEKDSERIEQEKKRKAQWELDQLVQNALEEEEGAQRQALREEEKAKRQALREEEKAKRQALEEEEKAKRQALEEEEEAKRQALWEKQRPLREEEQRKREALRKTEEANQEARRRKKEAKREARREEEEAKRQALREKQGPLPLKEQRKREARLWIEKMEQSRQDPAATFNWVLLLGLSFLPFLLVLFVVALRELIVSFRVIFDYLLLL